jgi:hypothetical protein
MNMLKVFLSWRSLIKYEKSDISQIIQRAQSRLTQNDSKISAPANNISGTNNQPSQSFDMTPSYAITPSVMNTDEV